MPSEPQFSPSSGGAWGSSCPRILILGAGCAGLGAAFRLHEIGYPNFLVLERNPYPGGLSASVCDERGFTWDLGGHVLFSHYPYFDALIGRALGAAFIEHVRQSYIWMRGAFIPYPFQNNLRSLPPADLAACLKGLINARLNANGHVPSNFREWIVAGFGQGIADAFLLPYNFKVWAHPPEIMDCGWVGERVARVDLDRAIDNVILGRDDPGWGPNNTFRFPEAGGTGAIWKAVASLIPQDRFRYGSEVAGVDTARRVVRTADGGEHAYDWLISTLPLDVLAELSDADHLVALARPLAYSTTHVVGVGLAGQAPEHLATKNWIYFPEDDCPFYRVTVFSNYSPANTPDPRRFWSLMAEVSESPFKPTARDALASDVVRGMLATRLIRSENEIVSTWACTLPHGYPVPALGRDACLAAIQPALESRGIYSRGRFGAWKYEVGNQDHTCMQGVEIVNRLLFGVPEMTLSHPDVVNATASR